MTNKQRIYMAEELAQILREVHEGKFGTRNRAELIIRLQEIYTKLIQSV